MRKLIIWIIGIIFLMLIPFSSSYNCATLRTVSSNGPVMAGSAIMVAGTHLNKTPNDHLWRALPDSQTRIDYFYIDSSYNYQLNSTYGFDVPGLNDAARTVFDCGYNFTGMNTTECFINTITAQARHYFWNGTNMTNNTGINLYTLPGFFADADNKMRVMPKFLNNVTTAALASGPSNRISGFILNGTNFYQNDSVASDLPENMGQDGWTTIFNMTGEDSWNFIVGASGGTEVQILRWDGVNWTNNTRSLLSGPGQINGNSAELYILFNTSYSQRNFTWLAPRTSGTFSKIAGYGNVSFLTSQSSSANTTLNAGLDVNLSFGWQSACGTENYTIATNLSAVLTNVSSFTTTGLNLTFNASQNISIGNICSRLVGGRVYILDRNKNELNFSYSLSTILPLLYNSTATAIHNLRMSCTSGTNVTVTINTSATLDFVVNMSALMLSGNRTCPYGADRINRIENRNTTRGCDVLVFGANMTQSQNITIDISEAISPLNVSNLPVAVGAAGLATVIVVYVLTRKRRTD